MDQFFKIFGSADQLLIIAAVALILIGLLAPKRFLGIEVDWNPAKSAGVVIIGLAILAFSLWRFFLSDYDLGSYDTGSYTYSDQPHGSPPKQQLPQSN